MEVSDANTNGIPENPGSNKQINQINQINKSTTADSLVSMSSRIGFRQSFFYSLLSRSASGIGLKKKSEKPLDPPELLECITTSFNERIPSPEHKPELKPDHTVNESEPDILPRGRANTTGDLQYKRAQTAVARLKHGSHPREKLEQLHAPLLGTLSNASTSSDSKADTLSVSSKKERPNSIVLRSHTGNAEGGAKDRKSEIHERKAAKTLSAVLIAFICTWSPYMLFTMINAFDSKIIPDSLYSVGKPN